MDKIKKAAAPAINVGAKTMLKVRRVSCGVSSSVTCDDCGRIVFQAQSQPKTGKAREHESMEDCQPLGKERATEDSEPQCRLLSSPLVIWSSSREIRAQDFQPLVFCVVFLYGEELCHDSISGFGIFSWNETTFLITTRCSLFFFTLLLLHQQPTKIKTILPQCLCAITWIF